MYQYSYIKPCAFCKASKAEMIDNRSSVVLQCGECGAKPFEQKYLSEDELSFDSTKGFSKIGAEKEVIKKWNRRISWLENLRLRMKKER